MGRLDKQIALVTGASRGIGEAILARLAAEGAIAVGTATSASGAQAISDRLAAAGQQGMGLVLDVNSGESVNALFEQLKASVGAPTILVNNAGITRDNLLMRMSEDEWDSIISTNLGSVYRLSKACLRDMMKARYGRIISIASVVAAMGNAGQCNYAATKAGILGFTRSLAREVGSRGITVNAVAPGFIDTDMTRALPDAQRQALQQQIPLTRLGTAAEVAAAVAFLASADASYISGETIHVNGGMYMG
ncbi:MAG: 3-oxoacyl-ACP reductase FabG [Gammaproteobacteria bacterium]|nr:3-oxoacyl-ACP reductase FabG [Gammaproteobacteria bacterium]